MRKSILSIALCLVLLLSMSTTAFAAESGDIKITYFQDTPQVVTIVDITWGSMEFNYSSGETKVWNPETLQYEVIPGESDGAWTPKNENGDTVTVTNHSNTELEVTVTYTPAEENGVTGSVTNGIFTLATAEGTDVNNAPKDSAKLKLDNTSVPAQWETEGATTIGNMTVTLRAIFSMDATNVTANDLKNKLLTSLNAGTTDISITLPEDAGEEETIEMFTALWTAFAESDAADGSVNLTLNGIKTIPYEGFFDGAYYPENPAGDKLKSLTLTDAESIGEYAFFACTKLTSIDIPNATTIGDRAFAYSSLLTSVNLPKVVTVGMGAFRDCDLRSVDLPEATTIGGEAFQNNNNLVSCSAPKATTIDYHPWRNFETSKLERLELTAAGEFTLNSNLFVYTPTEQIDLVLNKDKESQVTQNEDGTATWNTTNKDGGTLTYTFKSITFVD